MELLGQNLMSPRNISGTSATYTVTGNEVSSVFAYESATILIEQPSWTEHLNVPTVVHF